MQKCEKSRKTRVAHVGEGLVPSRRFGGFALCTKSPNIFTGKYLCAPGGRKGRPYGKTIVFTTPVHFCNTPQVLICLSVSILFHFLTIKHFLVF